MSDPGAAGWRETELGIVGGLAHALNGALGALTMAVELAHMDHQLPDEAFEVLDQQLRRLQTEVEVLFSLPDLEDTEIQLQDPLELAETAVRLFKRLSTAGRATVRTTRAPDVVAVEVAAGPCIRSIVLCLRACAAAFTRPALHEIELHLERAGDRVVMEIRCDDPAITPLRDLLDAASAILEARSDTRFTTQDGRITLVMQTPP